MLEQGPQQHASLEQHELGADTAVHTAAEAAKCRSRVASSESVGRAPVVLSARGPQ